MDKISCHRHFKIFTQFSHHSGLDQQPHAASVYMKLDQLTLLFNQKVPGYETHLYAQPTLRRGTDVVIASFAFIGINFTDTAYPSAWTLTNKGGPPDNTFALVSARIRRARSNIAHPSWPFEFHNCNAAIDQSV